MRKNKIIPQLKSGQIAINVLLLLVLCSSPSLLNSQVLISENTGATDSSAMLEIKSTSRGLLPPRLTSSQRDAIDNPTAGLIIYCSDCLEMQMFNDTAWTNMIGLPAFSPPIPSATLGDQVWMENNIDIGVMISGNVEMTDNGILEKYCYDDDPANCAIYGALYQWDEMMQYVTTEGAQGICPTGFHLPSDEEWKVLEMELGMSQAQADAFIYRGTDQGSQIAANEPLWTDGNLDQNSAFGTSEFMTLPAGLRLPTGLFDDQSTIGGFWTSSESDIFGLQIRGLESHESRVFRGSFEKSYAFSVRCVQD